MAHFIVAKLWLLVDCGFLFAESRLILCLSVALLARWSRNEKPPLLMYHVSCWCQVLIRMQLGAGQGDGTDVITNCVWGEPVTVVWRLLQLTYENRTQTEQTKVL